MTFYVLDPYGNCAASGETEAQAIAQACEVTMNRWDNLHRSGWSVVSIKSPTTSGWWILPAIVLSIVLWGAIILIEAMK
ncbi:MAG: hypothetical protein QM523_01160 [Candidatus Pacebacteria bacterium]|nr:hypothetical protein [Candidatus Paceibacterota bacterium]